MYRKWDEEDASKMKRGENYRVFVDDNRHNSCLTGFCLAACLLVLSFTILTIYDRLLLHDLCVRGHHFPFSTPFFFIYQLRNEMRKQKQKCYKHFVLKTLLFLGWDALFVVSSRFDARKAIQ